MSNKWRSVMEDFLGRKLENCEHIHHIDCNPYNNNIENLFLTDTKGHGKAHRSLNDVRIQLGKFPYEKISLEKFQEYLVNWLIIFDKKLGIYMIC